MYAHLLAVIWSNANLGMAMKGFRTGIKVPNQLTLYKEIIQGAWTNLTSPCTELSLAGQKGSQSFNSQGLTHWLEDGELGGKECRWPVGAECGPRLPPTKEKPPETCHHKKPPSANNKNELGSEFILISSPDAN